MKSIKKIVPAFALILLAGGAFYASDAKAYACPCGGGMMEQSSNITDAQRQEARTLVEQAQGKMDTMKQQLFVKYEELKALQNAATPDVKAVSQKASEITDLQQKLSTERKNLGDAIDKALGLEPGTHSLSRHGRGMGHGKGHGYSKGMGHGNGMGHDNGYGRGMRHGEGHNNGHRM